MRRFEIAGTLPFGRTSIALTLPGWGGGRDTIAIVAGSVEPLADRKAALALGPVSLAEPDRLAIGRSLLAIGFALPKIRGG
jgi:hypothetical protein